MTTQQEEQPAPTKPSSPSNSPSAAVTRDPEQEFLLARQNRFDSKKQQHGNRQHQANELYTFWTILRSKLSNWQERLDALEETKEPESTNSAVRQPLEDLKQELYMLRKHCLATSGGGGALLESAENKWKVPDFLPVTDLRLLHSEFTNYFQKWESAKQTLIPKEKFAFRKYRQEVARRKALGLSLAASSSSSSSTDPRLQSKLPIKQPAQDPIDGMALQDLSNQCIIVDTQGRVMLAGAKDDTLAVSADSLLLRNLQSCTVRIDKPLQALHLVGIRGASSITVSLPISSAVHITNCHDCSIRVVLVQQLRLHESTHLQCHVQLVSAGAILEDCHDVVFLVPPPSDKEISKTAIDVKDFNWLREGIPSPNFRIEEEPRIEESAPSPCVEKQIVAVDTEIEHIRTDTTGLEAKKRPSSSPDNTNNEGVANVQTVLRGESQQSSPPSISGASGHKMDRPAVSSVQAEDSDDDDEL